MSHPADEIHLALFDALLRVVEERNQLQAIVTELGDRLEAAKAKAEGD